MGGYAEPSYMFQQTNGLDGTESKGDCMTPELNLADIQMDAIIAVNAYIAKRKQAESLADCAVVWRPGWPVMNRQSVEKVGVQE